MEDIEVFGTGQLWIQTKRECLLRHSSARATLLWSALPRNSLSSHRPFTGATRTMSTTRNFGVGIWIKNIAWNFLRPIQVDKTNFGLCFQTNALSMGGCLRNLVLFIFFLLEKLIKINKMNLKRSSWILWFRWKQRSHGHGLNNEHNFIFILLYTDGP